METGDRIIVISLDKDCLPPGATIGSKATIVEESENFLTLGFDDYVQGHTAFEKIIDGHGWIVHRGSATKYIKKTDDLSAGDIVRIVSTVGIPTFLLNNMDGEIIGYHANDSNYVLVQFENEIDQGHNGYSTTVNNGILVQGKENCCYFFHKKLLTQKTERKVEIYRKDMFGFLTSDDNWKPGHWLI